MEISVSNSVVMNRRDTHIDKFLGQSASMVVESKKGKKKASITSSASKGIAAASPKNMVKTKPTVMKKGKSSDEEASNEVNEVESIWKPSCFPLYQRRLLKVKIPVHFALGMSSCLFLLDDFWRTCQCNHWLLLQYIHVVIFSILSLLSASLSESLSII